MGAAGLLFVSLALAAQSPAQPVGRPLAASACSLVSADALTDTAVGEICAGDDAARAALRASDSTAKTRSWREAADRYRRAARLSPKVSTKVIALNSLASLFDSAHLDDMKETEATLRELMTLTPDDLSPLFRLAKAQEDHELLDPAEDTLQLAKRQQPDAVEPYTALAAFYTRRATARRRANESGAHAGRDEKPTYRVGGDIRPPTKVSDVRPQYPPEALAAGIRGTVILEVTVNEAGNVIDARILRSLFPALDSAALEAVRQWQFAPSIVNGRAVPVTMTVTVNFAPPSSEAPSTGGKP